MPTSPGWWSTTAGSAASPSSPASIKLSSSPPTKRRSAGCSRNSVTSCRRPDNRQLDPSKRASLHAKCVVVDEEQAFVSSANFTEAGQTKNIEVGVHLVSRQFAERVVQHFESL